MSRATVRFTRRQALGLVIGLVGLGVCSQPTLGQSAESRAEATVMALAEQTWTLLAREDLSPEQRQDELAELIESRTDVALLSRLVLGRHWRELTDDQKTEYQRLFRVVIIRNLAGKLGRYAEDADGAIDQHFQIRSSQLAGKGDVLVRSKVLPSSGALAVGADVTDRDAMRRAFDEAESTFGVVNVVVNNAGMNNLRHTLEVDDTNWRKVIGINLDAVFWISQEAAKRMVKAGIGGSIINVASVDGRFAERDSAPYCAAKGGVVQLVRAMALDLVDHGIRVNGIAPGFIATELTASEVEEGSFAASTPMKRAGKPEEFSGPFILLASDASSFVNGEILFVDGALTVRAA